MTVPLWVWAVTVALVIGLLLLDFLGHVRTPHPPALGDCCRSSTAVSP